MSPGITRRTRPTKPKKQQSRQKRKRDDISIEKLQEAIDQLDPKATPATYTTFTALPLSPPTLAGLESAHFTTLTTIQAQAIPLALKGTDILGAAQTGSGKTLAFLIPVLENLYRAQCVGADAGLAAMIISPTRELAIQIFEVLRKIGGRGHLFAAGLLIGGKSLRDERDALARMNVVVCTPGRILQHLSQTAGFSVDNLRMLVLDEADRIMDMGFAKDVDAIIEYLPRERQTLLFSATQTKRVSDLSRLALKDPEYISVHAASATSTPQTLQQNYVLTPLPTKLNTLWSFLQSAKKAKTLVFLSSGKQVRFVYEAFRHMQPGIPLLHLHGRQKQTSRLEITEKFSRAKHSCLFATDVVARGLDFPAVDWVVQVDCPEDAETYIHRVGRTARFEKVGRAVLFLDPGEEEGMLRRLEQKRVPIEKINIRDKKQRSISNQLQGMCFKDPALKYLGQKAFCSYVRSLHVQRDKEVFRLEKYDLEAFAASLGLPGQPRIKFLKADAEEVKRRKNAPRAEMELEGEAGEDGDEEGEGDGDGKGKNGVRTKYDRMFERRNQDVLAERYLKMVKDDDDDDDDDGVQKGNAETDLNRLDGEQAGGSDDDLFDIKQRIPAIDDPLPSEDDETNAAENNNNNDPDNPSKTLHIPGATTPLVLDSKRREKLLKSKKKLLKLKDKGSKLVFDDAGVAHEVYELEDEGMFRARGEAGVQRVAFLEGERERVRGADVGDKVAAKEKKKVMRDRRRERERERTGNKWGVDGGAVEVDGGSGDAMADFLADAEAGVGGGGESDDGSREASSRSKRQRKWFEKDDDAKDDGRRDAWREIGTLDELEAEAARLLA